MGIHTGDSITVAPIQTLTDKEYQKMRDASIACIREIDVETGGSNIQFAVHPQTGRMVIIEMNPRVSRSSALASKATGFPIAKIAAKLAVGYTLDEIANDITRKTPACFEPTIDYCVVKIPRFTFEKFASTDPTLGVSMKSVGEVMAIGRTFKEALQKALRSLEIGLAGLDDLKYSPSDDELKENLRVPNALRVLYIKQAIKRGSHIEEIHKLSQIDPWFLENIRQIVELEEEIRINLRLNQQTCSVDLLRKAKEFGFSDLQLARLLNQTEDTIRKWRIGLGIKPAYLLVDTCAAEFEAFTPYYYSTYES
jgi:carbamoyl-phosphate synthase large subunit